MGYRPAPTNTSESHEAEIAWYRDHLRIIRHEVWRALEGIQAPHQALDAIAAVATKALGERR